MYSSRMHTARLLTVSRSIRWGGGSAQPPGCKPPSDADPPRNAGSLGMQTPDVNRMIHRCKNITLPQTLFADGKNCKRFFARNRRPW